MDVYLITPKKKSCLLVHDICLYYLDSILRNFFLLPTYQLDTLLYLVAA